MMPILRAENLSKYYINGRNVVAGLNRVNLSFRRGEFVAITGESGSGKSTLAHVLGGVLPYEDGELYINGEPTAHFDGAQWEAYRRDHVAFISQNYGILPGSTVYDNVASALRLGGMEKGQVASRTKAILEEVELWPMRRRRSSRLSSGQKQRLAIARALAKPCTILIADEPTGNLDPENSEKVIRLLAQAAKDRLVILITHEFSEAEDYVTRHIRIHDGFIAGDESLRPVPPQTWEPEPPKKRPKLGAYVAGLHLRSRPVWCAVVLLFFATTAFAVFAFLGSFVVAMDDTSTRIYDPSAFLNGDKERIVAIRKDGAPMTEADYAAIAAIKRVEYLERYGYVADMLYAYREDVDYKRNYSLINVGSRDEPVYHQVDGVVITTTDQFVQTVPYGADSFLTGGRLPETVYEVVAGDENLLGQTITVYIQNPKNWAASAYLELSMQVVGATDCGSGLYFADDLAAVLTLETMYSGMVVLPVYEDIPAPAAYIDYVAVGSPAPYCSEWVTTEQSVYRPIAPDEVIISFGNYLYAYERLGCSRNKAYNDLYALGGRVLEDRLTGIYMMDDPDVWHEEEFYINGMYTVFLWLDVHVVGINHSTFTNTVGIHPDKFESYLSSSWSETWKYEEDQVSITISDYSYTDRVIRDLEKAGYYALSPYVLGSTTVDEELAQQRLQTLGVCLGALLAVILLQMIVLRALFAMGNEDYRILSQIGLTWGGAKRSVWLQVLGFMVAGQALAFGVVALGSALGLERFVSLTKYLHGIYWVMLSVVHLVVSVVAARGILASLKKKIFPQAGTPRDLAPSRKEAAK